ncbi:cytochrome P450 [Nonomuraea sp. KC401]|uniref:cytochrome P450 n=1 Tax=unclassified Nonomuraea TaxID=2593643 RepID=UPI0010FF0963|nr:MULTISPECIES: cytochrome P450 [unclassified Nonomuraea]NBE98670.1 cytochrome P450 [Nonomuraea sp. K271]TLF55669.1 cytochrome P450 [Nonomuraea sp. KC401]
MLITRHAEARAVLSDPAYVPPPVRQDGAEGTLAWLRAQVSRFSTGETHTGRRRVLAGLLAGLEPAGLRRAATAMTVERDGDWRGVPTAVLASALGVEDRALLADAVPAAASGYLSGEETPEADAAVARLLTLAGVPVITLLLQGYAATEGLIEAALRHAEPGDDPEALLCETLRHDPPLRATRRLDTRTGETVTIELVAANRDPDVFADPERFDPARGSGPHLTFGSGIRPCPAPGHALALAAGVLDALLAPPRTPPRPR